MGGTWILSLCLRRFAYAASLTPLHLHFIGILSYPYLRAKMMACKNSDTLSCIMLM
jgi:hypothetical protein